MYCHQTKKRYRNLKPIVSIIIPVYKVPEQYLSRCIRSCLAQTIKEIQIIIVHDHANDRCGEICDEFASKERRVLVIHRNEKKNVGLSAARNIGMQYAKGEWIYFIDGDDWIDDDCLEKCLNVVSKTTDIILFPYRKEYKNKSVPVELFHSFQLEFEREQIREKLLLRIVGPTGSERKSPTCLENFNPVWNKLYRRKLIQTIKFVDACVIGSEDLWFTVQAFYHARSIRFIKTVYYHYNKENANALTRNYNQYLFSGWKTLYGYLASFLEEHKLYGRYREALDNRIILNLFSLIQNICFSGLSRRAKKAEMRKILDDKQYEKAFLNFSYKELPILWKPFYYACFRKKYCMLFLMMYFAEMIRKILSK